MVKYLLIAIQIINTPNGIEVHQVSSEFKSLEHCSQLANINRQNHITITDVSLDNIIELSYECKPFVIESKQQSA